MFDHLRLPFGYAEMFEFGYIPEKATSLYGRFVQFCEDKPSLVQFATDPYKVFGISTACSGYVTDNPNHWFGKFVFNEYGDLYLQKKEIAQSKLVYNSTIEHSYLTTYKTEEILPIISPSFDETKEYIPRNDRGEWIKINLIGKTIVEDNGKCKPGEYCKLYTGNKEELIGTAVKATNKDTNVPKYYVLDRVSDKTILILYK